MQQQCFNVVCIFGYGAKNKRQLWKRRNAVQLEKALDEANKFFPGAKNMSVSVVTIAPSVNLRSDHKRRRPEEVISLDIEAPKDQQLGPIVRCHRHRLPLLSVNLLLLFVLLLLSRFLCQLLQRPWSYDRRAGRGECRRGCLKTSYLMRLPPT